MHAKTETRARRLARCSLAVFTRFPTVVSAGETRNRPHIGIFPMAELATGNAARNLGDGHTWYRLSANPSP